MASDTANDQSASYKKYTAVGTQKVSKEHRPEQVSEKRKARDW